MVSRFWTLALAEVSYKYGFSSIRPFATQNLRNHFSVFSDFMDEVRGSLTLITLRVVN